MAGASPPRASRIAVSWSPVRRATSTRNRSTLGATAGSVEPMPRPGRTTNGASPPSKRTGTGRTGTRPSVRRPSVLGMMRPQPLIAVADVEAGSRWFQQVLGLTSGHGGPDYEMLLDGGEIAAQLHQWEADEHPYIGNPGEPSRGNGVLLWFWTDDFDAALGRVQAHDVTVLDGPLFNPNSRNREVWVRGPEGYVVGVAGPGEAPA